MQVKIEVEDGKIFVTTPFSAEFVAGARNLAGRWDKGKKAWAFDARNGEAIRALCMEVYGSDGVTSDLITVKITMPDGMGACCAGLEICGRALARAYGRDSGAKISGGVVVLSGGFDSSGSVKNWRTIAKENTVILLHDFPRTRVKEIQEMEDMSAEIIEAKIDFSALEKERARLTKRIDEINAILASDPVAVPIT